MSTPRGGRRSAGGGQGPRRSRGAGPGAAKSRSGAEGAGRSGRSGGERGSKPRAPQRNGGRTDRAVAGKPATGSDPGLPVPEDADVGLLDRSVRAELRSLSKPNAEAVGKHLVAAGELVDSDPQRALAHARAARARAARVAAVREAVGVAAYHAGEWAEALTELRTARRISGDPGNLPLIADTERALGRPEQAARVLDDPDVRRLDAEARAELLIVVAGARRDLGQFDAALSVLARGGLDPDRPRPGAARLWYAYADALEALGRREEAARWFAASAIQDPEGELDSAERAAALL
jgi:tetratricopeptide (TPR) repeat protein